MLAILDPDFFQKIKNFVYFVFFYKGCPKWTPLCPARLIPVSGNIYRPLGVIIPAVNQYRAIALLAVIPALTAKHIAANSPSLVQKQRPFLFELFRHLRHSSTSFLKIKTARQAS